MVYHLMQEDPKQRLSACQAANLLCLLHFHTLDETFEFSGEVEFQKYVYTSFPRQCSPFNPTGIYYLADQPISLAAWIRIHRSAFLSFSQRGQFS